MLESINLFITLPFIKNPTRTCERKFCYFFFLDSFFFQVLFFNGSKERAYQRVIFKFRTQRCCFVLFCFFFFFPFFSFSPNATCEIGYQMVMVPVDDYKQKKVCVDRYRFNGY